MRILLRDLEVGMRIWATLDEPCEPTEYTVTFVHIHHRRALLLSVANPHRGEEVVDPSDELFLDEKSCWLNYRESLRQAEEDERDRLRMRYDEMHRICNARLDELTRMTLCPVD